MAHGASDRNVYLQVMQVRSAHLRHRLLLALLQGSLVFLLHATPSAAAETALAAGEQLTYSVRWAVLPGAGEIRIAAAEHSTDGTPQISIITETETRGLAKSLMPFHARSESIFDLSTGRLDSLRESSVTRNKSADYLLRFDYESRHALFIRDGGGATRIDL